MPAAKASHPRPVPVLRHPLARVIFAGFAAASTALALHHIAPLENHEIAVAALICAVAACAALMPLGASLEAPSPLPVILSRGHERIEVAGKADLDFLATLHTVALEGQYARLGPRFLRAFLHCFVDSPHAVALKMVVRDTTAGMIVGVLSPKSHTRWMRAHRAPRLTLLGVLALVRRPHLAWTFARTRGARYRRRLRHRGEPDEGGPAADTAVLAYVAVAPGARGEGFGTALVGAFVTAAREAGCAKVVLTTPAEPSGAAGFYTRLGWTRVGEQRGLDGRANLVFELALDR